jgi:hypothetical protein
MNPWLLLAVVGVGAAVLFGTSGTASAASGGGGNYWPPTAADQAAVTQQLQAYATNATYGPNPPTDMSSSIDIGNQNAEIANLVAQSVGTYAAQTSQPTAAGWKQWVMTAYSQGLASSGYAPNTPAPYGGNPYAGAVASGPMLWAFPHARHDDPILSGHGLGW